MSTASQYEVVGVIRYRSRSRSNIIDMDLREKMERLVEEAIAQIAPWREGGSCGRRSGIDGCITREVQGNICEVHFFPTSSVLPTSRLHAFGKYVEAVCHELVTLIDSKTRQEIEEIESILRAEATFGRQDIHFY